VAQLFKDRGFDSRWVNGIFYWLNPFGCTMALRSTQPVTWVPVVKMTTTGPVR